MKRLIILIAIVSLFSCSQKDKISDLISSLHIDAGKSDTVSVQDMFFVSNYANVSFKDAPELNVIYLPLDKKLILKPRNDFSGLTYVGFSYNDQDYQIPVYVKYRVRHTFSYTPKENEKNIVVIGQFNTWNRNSPAMTDENNDGILERSIWLEPGRYEYKFYSEGNEFIDPLNPKTIPNPFGALNSVLEIGDPNPVKPTLRNKGFLKTGKNP